MFRDQKKFVARREEFGGRSREEKQSMKVEVDRVIV